jgi:hypothetical protein
MLHLSYYWAAMIKIAPAKDAIGLILYAKVRCTDYSLFVSDPGIVLSIQIKIKPSNVPSGDIYMAPLSCKSVMIE